MREIDAKAREQRGQAERDDELQRAAARKEDAVHRPNQIGRRVDRDPFEHKVVRRRREHVAADKRDDKERRGARPRKRKLQQSDKRKELSDERPSENRETARTTTTSMRHDSQLKTRIPTRSKSRPLSGVSNVPHTAATRLKMRSSQAASAAEKRLLRKPSIEPVQ